MIKREVFIPAYFKSIMWLDRCFYGYNMLLLNNTSLLLIKGWGVRVNTRGGVSNLGCAGTAASLITCLPPPYCLPASTYCAKHTNFLIITFWAPYWWSIQNFILRISLYKYRLRVICACFYMVLCLNLLSNYKLRALSSSTVSVLIILLLSIALI